MSSDNLMITTLEKGGATTIDIDGVQMDIWVKFNCQFQQIPTPEQIRRNKKRMSRYLKGDLLGRQDGDLFSLIVLWYRDSSYPSKYRVVVAIFETEPPPGSSTVPPAPPPGAPGGM